MSDEIDENAKVVEGANTVLGVTRVTRVTRMPRLLTLFYAQDVQRK